MSHQKQEPTRYIFESPDDGKTVKRREFGQDPSMSKVISQSSSFAPCYQEPEIADMVDWFHLFDKAKSNKSLHEALNHAILIYNVIKEDDK